MVHNPYKLGWHFLGHVMFESFCPQLFSPLSLYYEKSGGGNFLGSRDHEGSLSAVNSSELLRLCLQAQAEAQHEWYSKSETQGNFFRV